MIYSGFVSMDEDDYLEACLLDKEITIYETEAQCLEANPDAECISQVFLEDEDSFN